MQNPFMTKLSATCIALVSTIAVAQTAPAPVQPPMQQPMLQPDQRSIQQRNNGRPPMSKEERTDYHNKMRAAQTKEEREKLRQEHHEQMKERAKAQGLKAPEEPPGRVGGRSPGGGWQGGNGSGAPKTPR